jgi:hypothetical protein
MEITGSNSTASVTDNRHSITVAECRQFLKGTAYSDAELEQIIAQLIALAELSIEAYYADKQSKQP